MVQVGLLLSDVPSSVSPAQQFKDLLRIVEAAQRNDFTYIAIGQHFLYGDLRWLQPVPLLARLAAEVGPDVRLVTQILIAPLYHPVMLAEELATLDVVTEGRLIAGLGLGYRPEEFGYLDVPFKERAARMDESIVLMKKLWTDDEVDFAGRFWTLSGVKPHLKPVQQPHPPIWIGGNGRRTLERVAASGQGWMAMPVKRDQVKYRGATRLESVEDLRGFVRRLHRYADEHGRTDDIDVIHSTRDLPMEWSAHLEALREFAEAGVTWAVWNPAGDSPDEAEELIYEYGERVIAQFADADAPAAR
jgi:probable F420-dependent oxidoreductase